MRRPSGVAELEEDFSDGSGEVIEQYAEKDHRVRHLTNERNMGMVGLRIGLGLDVLDVGVMGGRSLRQLAAHRYLENWLIEEWGPVLVKLGALLGAFGADDLYKAKRNLSITK